MKNLIIVESPTKAKTIQRFVDKNFQVESSYGHVRDLPKSQLGVDTEHNFEPKYIIPQKAKKLVTELKKLAEKANSVILATDQDREGEAISWHLMTALNLDPAKTSRITFHEITKSAIDKALANPGQINLNLVNSQQGRRILDRLVGYELSPLLWKKIARGLSAGRVQSVAVRLIAEREKEKDNFKPQEYWSIETELTKEKLKNKFIARLAAKDDKLLNKLEIKNGAEAKSILADLKNAKYNVAKINKNEVKKNPPAPFTTSTLQQEAWRRFRFTARQTMMLAQQLYEGIEIPNEDLVGLITYMRTDSLNLSEDALGQTKNFIEKNFGAAYAQSAPRRYKTKDKSAQEAHEAIRPTDPSRIPQQLKNSLDKKQYQLYELIWQRFLASQLPEAKFDQTQVDIAARNYLFRANGSVLKFDGFLKIYPTASEVNPLPELREGENLTLINLNPAQHFTEPKARFSEASLIKTLEEYGIGRPSTYAPTLSTIQTRGYVEKEGGYLKPTEVGKIVNDLLVEHFPKIVDLGFTAYMEAGLDKIAEGVPYQKILSEFYWPFHENVVKKEKELEKYELAKPMVTNEVCEKCGKPMVIKFGRFGKFLACSGFPDCKTTKPLSQKIGISCPLCHTGDIIERKTHKRKLFYGCSNYPNCTFASWLKPNGKKCPVCTMPLVLNAKNKIKCSNKECKYEEEASEENEN